MTGQDRHVVEVRVSRNGESRFVGHGHCPVSPHDPTPRALQRARAGCVAPAMGVCAGLGLLLRARQSGDGAAYFQLPSRPLNIERIAVTEERGLVMASALDIARWAADFRLSRTSDDLNPLGWVADFIAWGDDYYE